MGGWSEINDKVVVVRTRQVNVQYDVMENGVEAGQYNYVAYIFQYIK